MKEEVDLLIVGAAELATLAGGEPGQPLAGRAMDDVGLLPRGGLAIRAGRIVAVEEDGLLLQRYESRETLSAQGGTLVPGFCDPHTHPVFDGTREREFDLRSRGGSYADIMAAGGGIHSSVRGLRAATRERLAARLRQRLDRFLICGTTAIEAKSGYGLSFETELLSLELLREAAEVHAIEIDPTCLAAHQVPQEFVADRPGYLRLITDEILPEVARRGLARSVDVFCDRGAFSVAEARVVLEAARALGLQRRVHADEIAGTGAAELAAECGAQTADHLLLVSEAGLKAMLAAGTMPVLLPGTSFSLRTRSVAPARRMLELGLPVALGSDFNPGTSYLPSMVTAISLACGLLGLTVAEALCAATRNAAATLGLPGVRGQLVPGAIADVALLDIESHLQLGYQLGWNPVFAVVKDGQLAYQRGEPVLRGRPAIVRPT
ncbi:MAG: imidazolonepropionase [Planctomycetota bacterium]